MRRHTEEDQITDEAVLLERIKTCLHKWWPTFSDARKPYCANDILTAITTEVKRISNERIVPVDRIKEILKENIHVLHNEGKVSQLSIRETAEILYKEMGGRIDTGKGERAPKEDT